MATKFRYKTLDRDRKEIRILRLLASEDVDMPIQCQLEHTSLDDDARYEALSYTWGDLTKVKRVLLNGAIFHVTDSLFTALSALRRPDADRIMWIDAICINQEDTSERNVEVLRMIDIYRQASRVIVWLGSSSDSSAIAISHLLELDFDLYLEENKTTVHRAIRDVVAYLTTNVARGMALFASAILVAYTFPWSYVFLAVAWCGVLPGKGYRIVRFAERFLILRQGSEVAFALYRTYSEFLSELLDMVLAPDETITNALNEFFSRPWFCRMWVVQEVTAAKDVVIYCGPDTMTWHQLCSACKAMEILINRGQLRKAYNSTNFVITQQLRHTTTVGRRSIPFTPDLALLIDLLSVFRHFEATDPRDKIYALLGLAGIQHQQGPIEKVFRADYNQPVTQVYTQLVRGLVERTEKLDILRLCDGLREMKGLPSWTPNFTSSGCSISQHSLYRRKRYTLSESLLPPKPIAQFNKDGNVMTIRGFVIGRLSDDGELIVRAETSDHSGYVNNKLIVADYMGYFLKFRSVIWHLGVRTGLLNLTADTLARLLTYCFPHEREAIEAGHIVWKNTRERFGDVDAFLNLTGHSLNLSSANFAPVSRPGQKPLTIRSFHWESSLTKMTLKPTICHTSGPHAERGDLVCMFIGAAEPYLLREQAGHYVLVGDAELGPFAEFLWKDCELAHEAGRLALGTFELI